MIDIIKYNPIQNLDSGIISFGEKIKSNLNTSFDNKYENMIVKFATNFCHVYSSSCKSIIDKFIDKQISTEAFKSNKKRNRYDEEDGDLTLILEDDFASKNKNFLLIIPTNIHHDYKEYRNVSAEEQKSLEEINPFYTKTKKTKKFKNSETGHFIEFYNQYKVIFCSIDRADINNFYYMFFHTMDNNTGQIIDLKNSRYNSSDDIEFDEYEMGNQKVYNCISFKIKSTYKIKIKK